MTAWQDNWFTAADLDNIKGYGFNLVRVPFGWRTLVDAAGHVRRDAKGGMDFARMDWARARGRAGAASTSSSTCTPGRASTA